MKCQTSTHPPRQSGWLVGCGTACIPISDLDLYPKQSEKFCFVARLKCHNVIMLSWTFGHGGSSPLVGKYPARNIIPGIYTRSGKKKCNSTCSEDMYNEDVSTAAVS